ncbi:MAG: DNA repair protein RecN [Phascolarctobacterium sp.]|nr:DNA repair protein RecN [Phascolarctobacterium sp.]
MLQALTVHNFALIEDASASFIPGFNVFTGETGAGKSILIDAFGIVLGARASGEFVRSGTDGLWVQAIFDISRLPKVKAVLAEQGIEGDDELFLKRMVNAQGKSKALINGVQVPLAILKQIGGLLVDIHGQHENQALLKLDAARTFTDMFGGEVVAKALASYQELYAQYLVAKKHLEELQGQSEQQDLLLDRYAWVIQEIEDASLKVGEEETLAEEAKILANGEKIISSISRTYGALDADRGILSMLAQAKDELRYAARYDKRLEQHYENLDSAWITLDDVRTELADYLASNEFNANRQEEVQNRLDTIYRLQKKYGGTTEDVLDYLEEARLKYKDLKNVAEAIARAEKNLASVTMALKKAGEALTNARKASAEKLAQGITEHIRDLAMPDGKFSINFVKADKFLPTGMDVMNFMFSANLGEPMGLLEKVASGGELSRIALATKTVLMDTQPVSVMVFDEIDTGVGGVTAQKMAEKIAKISTVGQVLCITHLPQIAAFNDNHIFIEKKNVGGRTQTSLSVLDEAAKINEIMRMTAGESKSKAARENASELINKAITVKASFKR